MARIRTIKPETPQSETIGKLSRNARLLFIQLWTVVDDEGRARAASRMLASVLYPYDDDAKDLIDGWLDELEQQNAIRRYVVDGAQYLEIVNWLKHQKIDKPSKSRLPQFVEGSRIVAKPREVSATDLGPRTSTKDQDAEPDGSHSDDDEKSLFVRGKKVLGKSSGGLVAQLLKAKGSVPHARAVIEFASTKENPREYVGRVLAGPTGATTPDGEKIPAGII